MVELMTLKAKETLHSCISTELLDYHNVLFLNYPVNYYAKILQQHILNISTDYWNCSGFSSPHP